MDIRNFILESVQVKQRLLADDNSLKKLRYIGDSLVDMYKMGGKLLIAGNGGSAADAQHFAAEITCQFKYGRKARPAIALHTDTSALTAWSNDHSYDTAYARLIEAHGVPGDALVVISTSGNSKNLLQATRVAREKGLHVFGLLGRDGGALLNGCDVAIVVPSDETPRIQECHILIIHILCEILDSSFFGQDER